MATIRDVARRAGVAPITVSRVINNSGYVSDETRARVEQAIRELDYVPNMLGLSLRSKRTDTIGLVLTDITNPFWTTVARGVEDVANQRGYNVFLCNTDESEDKQNEYLGVLLRKQVDGMLLVPASGDADPIRALRHRGVPVVIMDRQVADVEVDCIRCDSEDGAYQLVRHLIDLGHRHVATLAAASGSSPSEERIAGCQRALHEAGLPAAAVLHGSFTLEAGYAMAGRSMTLSPRPTALFAVNNFIAIGALRAITDRGLRVPDDISLAGFDDLPAVMMVDPFLTVVSQPAYDMGQQAAHMLLDRLAGDMGAPPRETILPTRLVVRRSTAAPA